MPEPHEPLIIGFLCHWCSYAGADSAGRSKLDIPPNLHVVRVPCSSRVDPSFILKAFASGADGVLVCGCRPGECHYVEGNFRAAARTALLKKTVAPMGVEPQRIRLEWISASEGHRFAQVVREMVAALKALPPFAVGREAER